ncbi:hypothetical protein N657DRAFT_170455 [Parathielavia appendiculata]|uniref:Uncharacterized protein n=1 Tax=Parathielavia appendiculata TaxID=2587402 RepID=A0AAN6TUD9_9PEZI|nr:hypothetical protein N657DRAFT_170455 [Parathielavia appendiculata]
MICARCRHAFQSIVINDDTWIAGSNKSHQPEGREEQKKWLAFTHHPTYESFREATDQRCSVCIVLWGELGAEQQSLLADAIWTRKDSTSGQSLKASTVFLSQKRQIYQGGDTIVTFQGTTTRDWHSTNTEWICWKANSHNSTVTYFMGAVKTVNFSSA